MGIFDFFKSSESKEKDFIIKYGGTPMQLWGDALEKIDHKAMDNFQEYISIGHKSREFKLDNIHHWENVFKNKFVEQLKSGDLTIKDLELKIKNFELIKNVYSEYLSNLKKIGQNPMSMYPEHINLATSVMSGAKLALKEISLNPVENNKKSNPKTPMGIIEEDIYRGIDMAFNWFKKRNPTLEIICDEETMKEWYDFFKWCYAQDGASGEAENFIKESKSPEFDFEISSLMEKAINECSGWWEKYNTEHQDIAEENFRDKCNKCNDGFLDDEFEKVCEDCEGTGYDSEDTEGHWLYYDEAFNNISESVDKSSFKKLSKISLKDIDEFKEESNRVNLDETNDIGKITHHKGKPFTGIGFIITDGLTAKEITFENGLKHGISKSYRNGKLFYEAIYKNDNFVEVIRGFAADGKTSLDEKKLRIMKSLIKKLHEKN